MGRLLHLDCVHTGHCSVQQSVVLVCCLSGNFLSGNFECSLDMLWEGFLCVMVRVQRFPWHSLHCRVFAAQREGESIWYRREGTST